MNKPSTAYLKEGDNTGLALRNLEAGETLMFGPHQVTLAEPVPYMHKVCTLPIHAGDKILKKGEVIGVATEDISPGYHVHIHNMKGLAR